MARRVVDPEAARFDAVASQLSVIKRRLEKGDTAGVARILSSDRALLHLAATAIETRNPEAPGVPRDRWETLRKALTAAKFRAALTPPDPDRSTARINGTPAAAR